MNGGMPFTSYQPGQPNGRINLNAPPSAGGAGFLDAGESNKALGNGYLADSFPGLDIRKIRKSTSKMICFGATGPPTNLAQPSSLARMFKLYKI